MSLVFALSTLECLLIASDARVHNRETGFIRDDCKKLFVYNDMLVTAGIGDPDFIAYLDERIAAWSTTAHRPEEALEVFQEAALKTWKDFSAIYGPTRVKFNVAFLVGTKDSNGSPRLFRSLSEHSFVPTPVQRTAYAALTYEDFVGAICRQALPAVGSVEDLLVLAMYILREVSGNFATVGAANVQLALLKSNSEDITIVSPAKVTSSGERARYAGENMWSVFFRRGREMR